MRKEYPLTSEFHYLIDKQHSTGQYILIGPKHCGNGNDAMYYAGSSIEECINVFCERTKKDKTRHLYVIDETVRFKKEF